MDVPFLFGFHSCALQLGPAYDKIEGRLQGSQRPEAAAGVRTGRCGRRTGLQRLQRNSRRGLGVSSGCAALPFSMYRWPSIFKAGSYALEKMLELVFSYNIPDKVDYGLYPK